MSTSANGAGTVFFLTLILTFAAAYLGRRHAKAIGSGGLSRQQLNKWLIGLSAGATANSGFIVTGAVGLGYAYGPQWLFLPIAWLLGDIVFWYFFPSKINSAGRVSGSTTLSELLSHGLDGRIAKFASLLATILIVVCLGAYTSAQWLAGQKFLTGAFQIPDIGALGLFALLIVAYSAIGGFRGSVYADSVQAVLRIVGTVVALGAVIWFAVDDWNIFQTNLSTAGDNFLDLIPGNSLTAFLGFLIGFGAAGLGFGLGQPQLVSRYLAGKSPEETRSAWWIYIGFVQFTWIAMTLFGVILRGVMPDISDPEAGLSAFFSQNVWFLITGIIVADIFATIAATSNSLLIAMAQAVTHDLLPKRVDEAGHVIWMTGAVVMLGLLTMAASLILSGSQTVFDIAIASASLLAAGLAPSVMIKVLGWRRSGLSLLLSIVAGLSAAIFWKVSGFSAHLNEAAIGILVGLVSNWIVVVTSVNEVVIVSVKNDES